MGNDVVDHHIVDVDIGISVSFDAPAAVTVPEIISIQPALTDLPQ
jgi:hypothetical protein